MASIILKVNREKSLLRHHPGIFEGAVEKLHGRARGGDTVDIIAHDGKWLAKAAYSPNSQIRARVWTFDAKQVIDNNFFKNALLNAHKRRQSLFSQQSTNAYRLIAGESDGLPGITIDVYANVVVMQLLSAGAEKHRDKIIKAIEYMFPEAIIHERSDVEVRKKEGLDLYVQTHKGELPKSVEIKENELRINVDLINGHKTGFYLDQRRNRQIVGEYCKGKRVLNCFSYTGTFALYALKHGATSVLNVDVSESALEQSFDNIVMNFPSEMSQKVTHRKADVFKELREMKDREDEFDLIIMDPPKFIDNKSHLTKASRGYKDINRLACELLADNGILATFSCSGLMPSDLFNKIVADAALDANSELHILERLNQDKDHITKSTFPEGHYLKGLICTN